MKDSMQGHRVVVHLAASTDIPRGNQDPRIDFENYTAGTFHVMEAIRQKQFRASAFLLQLNRIRRGRNAPDSRNLSPLLSISFYGAGKLVGEGLISAYCHLYAIQAWIFRFGNVVGTRMGHVVIHDFINKLKRNPHELEILGDGDQEKNYFLLEDCTKGMFFAFHQARDKSYQLFNLGNESTIRVVDIARIVAERWV